MRLTQRLDLRLLAPTALMSLILIGLCLFGTLYLDSLHVNASEVLTENVRSTAAAARLETTARELVRLLRSGDDGDDGFTAQVRIQNESARRSLAESEALANLEHESVLVVRISQGLKTYLHRWDVRSDVPPNARLAYDGQLAELLETEVVAPCVDLRKFNTGQIEQSDQENRRILRTVIWGMLAVGVGGPVFGLLLGFIVARGVRRSIYQLSVHIRDAAGRLSREVGSLTLKEDSDLPSLQQQMRHMIEDIGRVVDQLEQREREVLRAEQLAAVGQVAAGVAHELRNPLAAIKMFVQAGLEGNPPPGLPAEELEIVEREIRRIERRLQTFLDFARPPQCERRRTDLVEVARRALALVEGRARQQKVTLATDLPAEQVFIEIDPEQVHQVMVNLLLNALDALPGGGTIRLSIRCREGAGGSEVSVSVRDNGAGIPPQVRGRLFEPFVSSKETGMGLGLSLCKRMVEAHGGSIQGTSPREGGALFTFTLPAEEANAVTVDCG